LGTIQIIRDTILAYFNPPTPSHPLPRCDVTFWFPPKLSIFLQKACKHTKIWFKILEKCHGKLWFTLSLPLAAFGDTFPLPPAPPLEVSRIIWIAPWAKSLSTLVYIDQGWPDFFVQGPYLKIIFECGPHFLTSYCYMWNFCEVENFFQHFFTVWSFLT